MMKQTMCAGINAAVLVTLPFAARAQELAMSRSTFAPSGESRSNDGSLVLRGTVGQPDAGPVTLTGGGFELRGGFWGSVTGQAPCNPDLNEDGVVGIPDVAAFINCLSSFDARCDFTHDGSITASDFQVLLSFFGQPMDPSGTTSCAPPEP